MQSVSLDTETVLISAEEPTPRMVCASYAFDDGKGILGKPKGVALFRRCLQDEDIEIVGQNIPFDFRVIMRQDPSIEPLIWKAYDEGRIYDTLTAARLDDIARGHYLGSRKGAYTLAAISDRYLGEHLEKDDTFRLRYGEVEGYEPEEWIDLLISRLPHPISEADIATTRKVGEEAISYPIQDADSTLRVRRQIGEPPDLRRQVAHDWWMDLMSNHGFPTDPKRVENLMRETIEEAANLIKGPKGLLERGFIHFDKDGIHRRVKLVQEYAVSVGVVKKTPKGAVSIDAEACEDSGDPLLKNYARLGQLLDIISKDLEYLKLPIVRARYGLAESGRSTCWGPNLQNLKVNAGIRECFVPPPGFFLAGADYEGLELCTVAQACLKLLGKSKLADMLNAGIDVHSWLAAKILRISYEDALKRKKLKSKDLEFYYARQSAKAANFGFPGGLGGPGMQSYAKSNYGVSITLERAFELRELWLTSFPEFYAYFDMIKSLPHEFRRMPDKRTGDMRDVAIYTVEQLFSGRIRSGCLFTEAANTIFQGLGGDATKAAGYEVTKACRIGTGALQGGHPLVYVHDEFLTKVRESSAHEAAYEMADIMVKAASVFLPDVPPKAAPYLCRRWSKDADTAFDKSGKLIPWEDAA
jgi:DNA polymerase I